MLALHNLHHLKRTRYLAGVSGGSWLTAVTVYNQNDTPDSVFYGASPPPEELTMAQLAELPKESLGYGATRDMFFGLLPRAARAGCLGCWTGDPGQVWSQSLGDAVLQPYGLGGDQFFTWNEQSREEALARNRHLKPSDFLLPREGAPFLILSTSSLGPPKDGSLLAGSGAPLLSLGVGGVVGAGLPHMVVNYLINKRTNAFINTGDGLGMAARAGLPLEDMEFCAMESRPAMVSVSVQISHVSGSWRTIRV